MEESTACLTPAAKVSKFMEGDKHPTSSLIVPMTYLLMKRCSDDHDVYFENRKADKFNERAVVVKHEDLQEAVQHSCSEFRKRIEKKFVTDVKLSVNKFAHISTLLDPRFKS